MTAQLNADCQHCFALCCTALAFSRAENFGHDKTGGEPCFHLDAQFRCRIHERREALGYEGCEAFDCLGAGQRASALFAPLNWSREPVVRQQMHSAFMVLLRVQEMRRALADAADLPLADGLEAERVNLLARLEARGDALSLDNLHEEANGLLAEATALLRRL